MSDLPDVPPVDRHTAVARRALWGFGPREIGLGVIAVAALALVGVWGARRASTSAPEASAIRAQLAIATDTADVYHTRIEALRAEATRVRVWAEAQRTEPLRTWARERARRFQALVSAADRDSEARAFALVSKEAAALIAAGEFEAAQRRLDATPAPAFPALSELERLRSRTFEEPLVEFSRQNPEFYRALRQFEPEVARRDEAALRSEIAAANADNLTPQLMLKLELLTAVAAKDDPLVTEWSAQASAIDYFEQPDSATLRRWRGAQKAMRTGDWATAAAEMQAILRSTAQTRQAFRAAYGRALLQSRPDAAGEAYPFLAEAAAAGDRPARQWVAEEDLRAGRVAQARAWLEPDAIEGDPGATAALLRLYGEHPDESVGAADRRAAVLEQIVKRSDAPAEASLMLGRLYERPDVSGAAPTKAFACYARAAAQGEPHAQLEVARCALDGRGTPANVEQALDAATAAFAAGAQEPAAGVLMQLLRRSPERTMAGLLRLFDQESTSTPAPFQLTRVVDGPGVSQLKAQLARQLERSGQYGRAARLYAGMREPAATKRHAELTAAHPCQTCGGSGKVPDFASCPTCAGKGRQICSFCGGTGSILTPGTPPCSTCGGAGTMIQDRKVVSCSTCGGSGKGKGSVIKRDCEQCEGGHVRCTSCTGGTVKITKECPDCRGRGTWSLVERSE